MSMRKKGQRDKNKILHMLPVEGTSISPVTEVIITKEMAHEFEKIGAILRDILIRQKANGYSIIGTQVYSPNNELIYEKDYIFTKPAER